MALVCIHCGGDLTSEHSCSGTGGSRPGQVQVVQQRLIVPGHQQSDGSQPGQLHVVRKKIIRPSRDSKKRGGGRIG